MTNRATLYLLGSIFAYPHLVFAQPLSQQTQAEKKLPVLTVGENGVKVPERTKTARPVVPAGVKPQGVTVLELIISPTGKVEKVTVFKPVFPPQPILDQVAVDTAKQYEFRPTVVRGVAYPVKLRSSINFNLYEKLYGTPK